MKALETLVIGGGISGLTTAWQLAHLGNHVQVWEADQRIGGKIVTNHDHGWTTEESASMVLNFLPEVNQFLQETGLENYKLLRTQTVKRYLIDQGALREMPMKMAGMLLSPLWSFPGKCRLFAEPFIFNPIGNKHESVADFIRRRLGSEMLEKAMSAYISGTLASDPELADSRAVFPHLTTLERRYGSITAGVFIRKLINRKAASAVEGFSFKGGMSTLVNELDRQLGGAVKTGYKVIAIEPYGKGWVVCAETPNGQHYCETERLILSTPAPTTAKLVKATNPLLNQLLCGIKYAPVSIVHLGFQRSKIKHPTEGTGFLTPSTDPIVLNGSMWMHSLFPDRAPEECVLMSNYLGGSRHPEIVHWSSRRLQDTATQELQTLLGIEGEAKWARVDRHQQALPMYHGKYMARQQSIAEELRDMPGLYLLANYLGGVSVRDRIICARKLAKQLSRVDQARTHNPNIFLQKSTLLPRSI